MENKIKSHRDLIAWQKGVQLVSDIYAVTRKLPESERYGLSSQLNRAAISIPANIAEGWGRETTKSYLQFLRTSRASVMETDTLLVITANLGFIIRDDYETLRQKNDEIGRIFNGLIRSLHDKISMQ